MFISLFISLHFVNAKSQWHPGGFLLPRLSVIDPELAYNVNYGLL